MICFSSHKICLLTQWLWKFNVSTAGPNDLAGFIPQPVKPICRSKYTGQLLYGSPAKFKLLAKSLPIYFEANKQFICVSEKKLNYAAKYVQLFIDLNYVPFQEIRNNIKQGTRRRITGNKAQETTTCNRNETEHRTERTQCLNTQGVLFGAWWDQQVTEESGKYLLPFP